MYTLDEYKKLTAKYGSLASWAIWDYSDEKNTSIISENISGLHTKYVLLGLNISGPLDSTPWLNFHGGSKHDRKLKYACNDTVLRGSYMTDLFKGIEEVNASQLRKHLTDGVIEKNVHFFIQEMKDIKLSDQSKFILFGNHVVDNFNKYFRKHFKNDAIIYTHYSYYGKVTSKEWVEGLWKKLEIVQDFEKIEQKYSH